VWARRNLGARQASGQLLLFASQELQWHRPEWLQVLASHALRPEVGAVGGRLLDADGRIREAGLVLGLRGLAGPAFEGLPSSHWSCAGNTDWTRDCSAVSAACLTIRRTLFLEEGGFDERFLEWGADVALCLRLCERGLRIIYAPEVELVDASSPEPVPDRDLWEAFLHLRPWLRRRDPYYNPHLSLRRSDGRLREHGAGAELLACGVLAGTL
jgi:GT2 family glycosyltransferase